ncbi:MAG TPA: sensor histidine kinase, partial [Mycobacteriales bacterium]|nr:sensor histidine kinase [Mycobacteriales bacterium]
SSAAVLEAALAMAALALASLAYGRWRQHGRGSDLWVCYGISVIAAGKIAFIVVPVLTGQDAKSSTLHAAALIAGAVGALFLLVGAAMPPGARVVPQRPMVDLIGVLGVVLVVSAVTGVAGHLTGSAFASIPDFVSTEATGDRGDVIVTGIQAFTAVVFGATALMAFRRRTPGDMFFGWLAVASVLWALARVNYLFTPGRLASWMTLGDWLRLAAYGVLAVGAARELRVYWSRLAEAGALEERRRMARELHDGLAQELAFIVAQSSVLVREHEGSSRHKLLRGAAERALDESRRAIAALTRPTDEPLAITLGQAAEEVGSRLGAMVRLDLDDHVLLAGEAREHLVRITREAVTNAVRHGQAASVTVRLSNHDGVTLDVIDDGCGFDPKSLDHLSGRLGLKSMEERAQRIGATFGLESLPGGGTHVQVRMA